MNTLTKLIVINVTAAVTLGSLTLATRADERITDGLPQISALTEAAGARIAKEANAQLVAAAAVAKPVRVARQPSVIITEGSDIVSEEIVVTASRLPALDQRVADAADANVVPARF